MKSTVLTFSVMFCLWFLNSSFHIWQEGQILEYKSSISQKEIKKLQNDLNYLEFLPDEEILSLESNYEYLDKQIRMFGRCYDLKVSMVADKVNTNALIFQAINSSRWLGIKQMSLHMIFYDLRNTDQNMTILKFLRTLENFYPLRVSSVLLRNNQVESQFQLYGR